MIRLPGLYPLGRQVEVSLDFQVRQDHHGGCSVCQDFPFTVFYCNLTEAESSSYLDALSFRNKTCPFGKRA